VACEQGVGADEVAMWGGCSLASPSGAAPPPLGQTLFLGATERDRNKSRSRRKPQPLRFKPVTIGDLIREGKLLEVHCGQLPAGETPVHQA
jgi:hypothetical protein